MTILTRQPDITIHTPMNLWILEPGEEPPPGACAQEINGVTVAFSPIKEEEDDEAGED